MARKKKRYTKKPKTVEQSFEKMFRQSLRKIKANQKDIETAISQVLTSDEIKVSEAEYNEIKRLTDTLNEIDATLENL